MAGIVRNQPDAVAGRAAGPGGLDAVVAVFQRMLEDQEHPGAQLAVLRDAELVLDLAGSSHPDGRPLGPESLLGILSTSKALTAPLIHALRDRGVFHYDDPVARHWPEFAGNGKEAVKIGQVMSHRAGLADAGDMASWFVPGVGGFLEPSPQDCPPNYEHRDD